METFTLLDYLALASLLFFWIAYSFYCKWRIDNVGDSLINVNHTLRVHWMRSFLRYPNRYRIADAQVVNITHRGISFFISTTVLIIAGLLAILSSGDTVSTMLDKLPYHSDNMYATWSLKIICMIMIFVNAFFRLTWSLRQSHNYLIAMFGAPFYKNYHEDLDKLAEKLASMITDSSKNFNNAMRSYYFGLSVLSWLIDPLLFVVTNAFVVWVIYRREFSSKTLTMLREINQMYQNSFVKEKLKKYD